MNISERVQIEQTAGESNKLKNEDLTSFEVYINHGSKTFI